MALKLAWNNDNEQAGRVAERCFLNMLEEMPPFIALYVLNVLYIDAASSAVLAIYYSAGRVFYTLAYSYFGEFTVAIEFATQANYVVIEWFMLSLVCKVATGEPLRAYAPANVALLTIALFVAIALWHEVFIQYPLAKVAVAMNKAKNPNAPKKA